MASAHTGRPVLGWLVPVAAAGVYAGDLISFRIGRRSTEAVAARLTHRRTRAAHARVHRLLHSRGGLVIVFARYLPGGRSTTAPAARFHRYTVGGMLLWALQGALPGCPGGWLFASPPLLGLLCAMLFGPAVTMLAVGLQDRSGRTVRTIPHTDR